MRVVVDTSVIVDIDRKRDETIKLMKKLVDGSHDIIISTVTVSEILAGSYMRKNFGKSAIEAKRILGQFLWVDLDGKVAEKTGQYLAYLITEGNIIEYQDVVIAATFRATDSDYLLTLNKAHFLRIPDLKGKIYEPSEFRKIMKQ